MNLDRYTNQISVEDAVMRLENYLKSNETKFKKELCGKKNVAVYFQGDKETDAEFDASKMFAHAFVLIEDADTVGERVSIYCDTHNYKVSNKFGGRADVLVEKINRNRDEIFGVKFVAHLSGGVGSLNISPFGQFSDQRR